MRSPAHGAAIATLNARIGAVRTATSPRSAGERNPTFVALIN
jgi:hypothetical protein